MTNTRALFSRSLSLLARGAGLLLGACALLPLAATVHAADAPAATPPAAKAATAHKPAAASPLRRLRAVCTAADLNHDGKLSLDEFHQDIVQGWHSLAPDAQGYVALDGLAQVPRMGRGPLRRLAAADTDGDGRLSFKEVVQARMAAFDAADTDQDDLLSQQECLAHGQRRRAGRP